MTSERAPRASGILAGTAVLAVALPWIASRAVSHRVDSVAARLGETSRTHVALGGAEVGLSGTLTLYDLGIGDTLSARAVEAGLSFESMARGRRRPDVVSVVEPRLSLRFDASGESNLEHLLRRLRGSTRHPRGGPATGGGTALPALPRVAIIGGTMTVSLGRAAVLHIDDVAVHPRPGGARITTGRVRAEARYPVPATLEFSRSAADIELPSGRVVRALAPAGRGRIGAGTGRLRARNATLSRGRSGRTVIRTELAEGAAGGTLEVSRGPGGGVQIELGDVPLAPLAGLLPDVVREAVVLSEARGSGTISAGAERLAADLALSRVTLAHPALAREPISLSARVSLAARRRNDIVYVQRAALTLGEVRVSGSGWVEPDADAPRFAATAELPPTPCADILEAAPAPLRRSLAGLEIDGTLGGRVELAYEAGDASIDARIDQRCRVKQDGPLADPRRLEGPFEQRVGEDRFLVGDGSDYVPLRQLPAFVPAAWIAAEDARFYQHDGFDSRQIERSLAANLATLQILRGGSTITQQLVKNVYLSPERTLARKLQEAVIAWRVESSMSKEQILDRYLNLIELGPRIYGVEAAARHWFGVSARELAPEQAAFLAALTRAPRTESRRIAELGSIPPDLLTRTRAIVRSMGYIGALSEARMRRAVNAPLALVPR